MVMKAHLLHIKIEGEGKPSHLLPTKMRHSEIYTNPVKNKYKTKVTANDLQILLLRQPASTFWLPQWQNIQDPIKFKLTFRITIHI